MSFAHSAIETRVAQVVPDDQGADDAKATSSVLVIARTPALGEAMAREMAQDDTVTGLVAQGTLSEVIAKGTEDWARVHFVVFEVSEDLDADLAALQLLAESPIVQVQTIAMSPEALPDTTRQLYEAVGVREILKVAAPVAPVPDATPAQPMTESTVPATPESGTATTGQITVLLRARGGAGASTLAVNLAVAAAGTQGAGKTALVDLDIQNGAVSLMLDLPESEEASAMVKGETAPDAAFLDRAMQHHDSGVDVLTAPDVFAPLTALDPQMLDQLLAGLQARYDTIILDMPQGIVDWIEPVLARATRVLLVSDTSLPAIKRTRRLLDLLEEEHMTLPVEIVMNQHKRPLVMSATLREVERLIGCPLNHWIPMDIKAAHRAVDMGQPLAVSARRSSITRAITALGESLFDTNAKG